MWEVLFNLLFVKFRLENYIVQRPRSFAHIAVVICFFATEFSVVIVFSYLPLWVVFALKSSVAVNFDRLASPFRKDSFVLSIPRWIRR